jgi:hypothetical protein
MLLSVLQTVVLWNRNPRHWLSAFLQACVDNRGQTPRDLSAFLPWQMTETRQHQLAQPMPVQWPPLGSFSQEMETPKGTDTS